MHFLAGGNLAWLSLLAVPILIHLINRRRAVTHRFAAVEFLFRNKVTTARRFRLKSLLLLLLRLLMLASLVLGGALPLFYSGADRQFMGNRGGEPLAVLFDNSASMAYHPDSLSAFSAGEAFLERYLEQEQPDRLILIPLIGEIKAVERDPASGLLGEWRKEIHLTFAHGDMLTRLRELKRLLLQDNRITRAVIVSDFTKSAFSGVPDSFFQGMNIRFILCQANPSEGARNVGLTGLMQSRRSDNRYDLRFDAEVLNGAGRSLDRYPLSLFLGEKNPLNFFLSGQSGERIIKSFTLDPEGRPLPAFFRLPQDSLRCDDRFYFVYAPPAPLRCLLVDGDPGAHYTRAESYFLERVLTDPSMGPQEVRIITPLQLDDQALSDRKLLFLCNLVPSVSQMKTIEKFVRSGNGLFISLGDHISIEDFNTRLSSFFGRSLRDRKRGFGHEQADPAILSVGGLDHPATRLLNRITDPQDYLFTDLFLLEPSPNNQSKTLLSLSSGEPLLLSAKIGKGQAFLYLSTMDMAWNTFPLRPYFLPFIRESARALTGTAADPLKPLFVVGDTLRFPSERMASLTTPSGNRFSLLPEADVVSFFGTDEPGFYQVRLPHGQEEYYAVNVDPVESDPALMDSLALNRLLSGTPWVMLSARDHLSGVILRPKPLWPYFFCAALLFALLESLLCASGLPKQNQETGHQDG